MAQSTPTQSGTTGRTSAGPAAGAPMASESRSDRSEFSNKQFIDQLRNVDVRATMHDLQKRGQEYLSESERYIRAHPLRVVVSAVGLGMIFGFFMRGKRVIHR